MDSRMVMECWNVERGGLASWLELRGAEGQQVCSAPGVDRKCKWSGPRGSASSVALARGLLLVRC